MFARVSLALAVAAGAVALLAVPASAHHKWGPYHWARTANPFTIKVVDATSWDTELNKALSDWSVSSVLDMTKDSTANDPATCSPVEGKVKVCNYTYGLNGWLGLAQIWITTRSHIYQGTSEMNDSYFNQSQYNTPGWRQLVMCQEPGHTLGLDHQDENFNNTNLGTCMDYTSDPDGPPANTSPNQHDYDQLQKIYQHLDSFTTPAANAQAPGQMQRIKDDLWVQNFPDGRQLFTWVVWADPTKEHGPPQVP